jgi:hypothetical protein
LWWRRNTQTNKRRVCRVKLLSNPFFPLHVESEGVFNWHCRESVRNGEKYIESVRRERQRAMEREMMRAG